MHLFTIFCSFMYYNCSETTHPAMGSFMFLISILDPIVMVFTKTSNHEPFFSGCDLSFLNAVSMGETKRIMTTRPLTPSNVSIGSQHFHLPCVSLFGSVGFASRVESLVLLKCGRSIFGFPLLDLFLVGLLFESLVVWLVSDHITHKTLSTREITIIIIKAISIASTCGLIMGIAFSRISKNLVVLGNLSGSIIYKLYNTYKIEHTQVFRLEAPHESASNPVVQLRDNPQRAYRLQACYDNVQLESILALLQ